MKAESLKLVVPLPIHASYKPAQASWLMSVGEFIEDVHSTQEL
jgi:hypothetical protein